MNTTTGKNTLPSEDIDLLSLIERIVLFLRKYKWTYLVAILVGTGLGFATYLQKPKVYKSRLILHSFTLSNLDYIQVISNWNSLLQSGENEVLASSLGLPPETVGKVEQMKGIEIQKVFTPNNPHGFYVDVFVTDNEILDDLQAGILRGLGNVDFIKKEVTIKKENLQKLIRDVGTELGKLDSTKSKIESMLNSRGGQTSSMIVDISGLNKQRIELNEKLLAYQKDIQFTTAVQVLQGFSKFSKPAGPRLSVWLGLGFIAGLVVASLVTASISIWRRVQYRLRQHNITQS